MEIDVEKLKKYKDILFVKRPVSQTHKPMEREKRAAQFAPFAALTGYEDAIERTRKEVEKKWEDEYGVEESKTEYTFYTEEGMDE